MNSKAEVRILGRGYIGRLAYADLLRSGRTATLQSLFSQSREGWPDDTFDLVIASGPSSVDCERPLIEKYSNAIDHLLRRLEGTNLLRKVVYISSGGAVYGQTDGRPSHEDSALRPTTEYARYHLRNEELLRSALKERLLIMRLSNPYGSFQAYKYDKRQGVIARLIEAVKTGEPFFQYGDGETVRDYLWDGDLGRLFADALDPKSSGTFNIGTGRGYSIKSLIALVSDISGESVKVINAPSRSEDIPYSVLNCARACEQLGWRASTSVEEGIKRLLCAEPS